MSEPCRARYAIYYTPDPEHPLTRTAAEWLGRDAYAPGSSTLPEPGHVELIASARRYGFHATLKPPFRLKEGSTLEELEQALGDFGGSQAPCSLGRLKLGLLGAFFALVPAEPCPAVLDFAGRVVAEFDRFRAPMDPAERGRRMNRPLDPVEIKHLNDWGYPYVFERYRYHMTLTDRVPADLLPEFRQRLELAFLPLLDQEYSIDALALFVQENPEADFVVRSRFALTGQA